MDELRKQLEQLEHDREEYLKMKISLLSKLGQVEKWLKTNAISIKEVLHEQRGNTPGSIR